MTIAKAGTTCQSVSEQKLNKTDLNLRQNKLRLSFYGKSQSSDSDNPNHTAPGTLSPRRRDMTIANRISCLERLLYGKATDRCWRPVDLTHTIEMQLRSIIKNIRQLNNSGSSLPTQNLTTGSGVHPATASISPATTTPGSDTDHSPLSKAIVKTESSYISTHPVSSWNAQYEAEPFFTLPVE